MPTTWTESCVINGLAAKVGAYDLLDTNIIASLWKEPQGKVYRQLQTVGENKVCTSIIVAAELRFRAAKRQSKVLHNWVEAVLSRITVLALEEGIDRGYAAIRAELTRSG